MKENWDHVPRWWCDWKTWVKEEDVVITISHLGYYQTYSGRSNTGRKEGEAGEVIGGRTREEDYIEHLFCSLVSSYDAFSLLRKEDVTGWMYSRYLKEKSQEREGPFKTWFNLPPDDKVRAIIDVKDLKDDEFVKSHNIVLCTKKGTIKKTALEEFSRPRLSRSECDQQSSKAMNCWKQKWPMAIAKLWWVWRVAAPFVFRKKKVRATGRGAIGVAGIEVDDTQDEVVGMDLCKSTNRRR